jgi:hypothetical protein
VDSYDLKIKDTEAKNWYSVETNQRITFLKKNFWEIIFGISGGFRNLLKPDFPI